MIINDQDIMETVRKMPPPPEAAYIKTPLQVLDSVVKHFYDPSIATQGHPLTIGNELMRFRKGEVSIWCGENHTGKSELLNQYLLSLVGKTSSFLMSPEMPLHKTLSYLCNQATALAKPSKYDIQRFLTYADDTLYLLDQSTTMKPDMILKLIRYVVEKYGVEQVGIDSLMKCGIKLDDHNLQHWFVDSLCVLAKSLDIHIHLVAHNRKPGQNERPSRYQVRGSSSIVDLADNVLISWRNFKKEDELESGTTADKYADLMEEPDGRLIVDKQRNAPIGEGRGIVNLWHKPEARTFVDARAKPATPLQYTTKEAAPCV